MESGMLLDERTKLRPAAVARVAGSPTEVEVTLQEGKNRQIRRMCERLGYRIITLHRTRIGSLGLGSLPAGKTRMLGDAEVEALRLISREDR
jgi:23S rRNA pseudouridine2605 synthase